MISGKEEQMEEKKSIIDENRGMKKGKRRLMDCSLSPAYIPVANFTVLTKSACQNKNAALANLPTFL